MNLETLHIAVLKGGPGSERRVSLASGEAVAGALRTAGFKNVTEVDVEKPGVVLPEGVGLCFNVIHGTFGEDGELQSELEALGVPYTGAGILTSRLAFNKIRAKEAFLQAKVPTPQHQILQSGDTPEDLVLDLPVVIKPPREGSSVGVHIVKEADEIAPALEDAATYDSVILAEQFISGRELTVGVVGDRSLPIVEIRPQDGVYDMTNKYPWLEGKGGGSDYFCPAELPDDVATRVGEVSLAAHRALGIEVYSRVDVLLNEDGEASVLEVNTIPGMTETSLLPKAAIAAGTSFPDLCKEICEISLKTPRN